MKPVNFYEKIGKAEDPSKDNPNYNKHGIKLPFRMLLVGNSGSMKTNTALDILLKISPAFTHITLVTRNADEPLYNFMKKKIPEEQLKIIEIDEEDLSGLPDIKNPTLQENGTPHTLVIFDDLVLVKNQRKICEFFIRARKCKISCMYLTQSYFGTPKIIRGNCNYIVFKKISNLRDLNIILRDYSLSYTIEQLTKIYLECTGDKVDWLLIKVDNQPSEQLFHNYTLIRDTSTKNKQDNDPVDFSGNSSDSTTESPGKTSKESPQKMATGKRKESPIEISDDEDEKKQENSKERKPTPHFLALQKLIHKFK